MKLPLTPTSKDAFGRGGGLDEAVCVRCAEKARPKAWLSTPPNQYLQRLVRVHQSENAKSRVEWLSSIITILRR